MSFLGRMFSWGLPRLPSPSQRLVRLVGGWEGAGRQPQDSHPGIMRRPGQGQDLHSALFAA